jgi:hypothetical protein
MINVARIREDDQNHVTLGNRRITLCMRSAELIKQIDPRHGPVEIGCDLCQKIAAQGAKELMAIEGVYHALKPRQTLTEMDSETHLALPPYRFTLCGDPVVAINDMMQQATRTTCESCLQRAR